MYRLAYCTVLFCSTVDKQHSAVCLTSTVVVSSTTAPQHCGRCRLGYSAELYALRNSSSAVSLRAPLLTEQRCMVYSTVAASLTSTERFTALSPLSLTARSCVALMRHIDLSSNILVVSDDTRQVYFTVIRVEPNRYGIITQSFESSSTRVQNLASGAATCS